MVEALAEAEERREVSQARQVKFTDRLTASLLIMGAGAEGAALAPILTAEDIANQRADKLQGTLEEARNERLKNAAEFIKKLREVFDTIAGLDPEEPTNLISLKEIQLLTYKNALIFLINRLVLKKNLSELVLQVKQLLGANLLLNQGLQKYKRPV